MINRKRLVFSKMEAFKYMMKNNFQKYVLCCISRKKRKATLNESERLFERAERRLLFGFDITAVVHRRNEIPIIRRMLMNEDQEHLLNMQKRYMVDSESSEHDHQQLMEIDILENYKNQYSRENIALQNKFARIIRNLSEQKCLQPVDRRLMVGVLERKVHD